MKRRAFLLTPATLLAQRRFEPRAFSRYPFEEWKRGPEQSPIRWSVNVRKPVLSVHQRLLSSVGVAIDSREVARLRGQGQLLLLIEIEDGAQKTFRTSLRFDLKTDVKVVEEAFRSTFFVTPGDYRISVALIHGDQHNFARRQLKVAASRNDPLPDSWRDVPSVDFRRQLQLPDDWYQPYLRGKVRLAPSGPSPIHIDLVMNMTPWERALGSESAFRHNMSVLVPTLKVLSGLSSDSGSLDIALLDLTNRKEWERRNARALDWEYFREPLAGNRQGAINIASLNAKSEMLQFLRGSVQSRLRPDASSVMIMLSAPLFLEHQQKAEPLRSPGAGQRVFYLRYRPLGPALSPVRVDGQNAMPPASPLPADNLEVLLRSVGARVFTVYDPPTIRRAIGEILTGLSRTETGRIE